MTALGAGDDIVMAAMQRIFTALLPKAIHVKFATYLYEPVGSSAHVEILKYMHGARRGRRGRRSCWLRAPKYLPTHG